MENKLTALADYLEVSKEEVTHAEGNTYETSESEYLVLTEEEKQEALKEHVRQSAWAFNPSFLAEMTELDEVIFTALQGLSEDSNEAVLKLIELTCGLDDFIEEAESLDGAGHFLASYDGEELELDLNLYAYRV